MKSIGLSLRTAVAVLALIVPGVQAFAQTTLPTSSAAAQYRLALGDTIRITVFQSPDLSLETRITEAGVISYPLLGSVTLAGLTVAEAEQRIASGLRAGNFLNQPQVSINVVTARGNQVSVLGSVGRPGRYPLETGEVRLTDMLATAGGTCRRGVVTSSSWWVRATASRIASKSTCRPCLAPTAAARTSCCRTVT